MPHCEVYGFSPILSEHNLLNIQSIFTKSDLYISRLSPRYNNMRSILIMCAMLTISAVASPARSAADLIPRQQAQCNDCTYAGNCDCVGGETYRCYSCDNDCSPNGNECNNSCDSAICNPPGVSDTSPHLLRSGYAVVERLTFEMAE